jgi:hypothetical protein
MFDLVVAMVTVSIYIFLGVKYLLSSRDRTLQDLKDKFDELEEEKMIATQDAKIAEQAAIIDEQNLTLKILREEFKCRSDSE